LYKTLHQAPKPREISFGVFSRPQLARKLRTRKITLEKHTEKLVRYNTRFLKQSYKALKEKKVEEWYLKMMKKLEAPNSVSQLLCMDARSCRVFALTKRTRGLPIFSPVDEWETFEEAKMPDYDFVYVDADMSKCEDAFEKFPYTGPRVYAAEVVEYMLLHKDVVIEDCKLGLRASRHMWRPSRGVGRRPWSTQLETKIHGCITRSNPS
jgi:hypothetical protein